MASSTSTPTRKGKRPRAAVEDGETAPPSSAKKPRLENSSTAPSPSTPRVLRAIGSAISGAFGRLHRSAGPKTQTRVSLDDAYDVPESDEEHPAAQAKKAGSAKAGPGPGKTSSAYDFVDSDDELASPIPPAGAPADSAGRRRIRAAAKETPTKPTRAARTVASGDGSGDDEEAALADDGTPSKSRGKRRRPEAAEQPIPKRSVGRGGAAETMANLEPDAEVPKLKGILTPSKGRGERGQKSVAFDGPGGGDQAEVYFEDLRTTTKKPAAGGRLVTSSINGATAGGVRKGHDAEEDDDGQSDDEDVCAVCSKPDSAPPNEIVLCDGCDQGYHQKCHGLPVIPKGEWLCQDCVGGSPAVSAAAAATTQKKSPASIKASDNRAPANLPNFATHLRTLQRVLLDRCTGRSRVALRGQDDARDAAFQLVEQTVLAGEGNSMLVIGARGSGKTTLVEGIISDLSAEHGNEFHVVRLNGFIHTDDKIALREIWRQLGREMEVEDEVVNKTHSHADTLASLLAVLSHPSEISETTAGATSGVTSKSVVFIMDEFDLFATHARQTLLYNLFDIAQARKAPIAVLGLTCRVDVVESLEKRVKSRFSHRHVHLSLPKSVAAFWDVCRVGLTVEEQDLKRAVEVHGDVDASASKGQKAFCDWWNKHIEMLRKEPSFQDHLEFHFHSHKSVATFWTSWILPLAELTPDAPRLQMPTRTSAGGAPPVVALEAPDSKLELLGSLSDLDLALLIAAARLDVVAHTDTVNFAMAYDEYTSLIGRQRVQTATSGVLALGGAARAWGRGVAVTAWERLVAHGLLIPAAGGGLGRGAAAGGGGNMGLEAKMWKVDVALEEIPTAAALRQTSVLARWCGEI